MLRKRPRSIYAIPFCRPRAIAILPERSFSAPWTSFGPGHRTRLATKRSDPNAVALMLLECEAAIATARDEERRHERERCARAILAWFEGSTDHQVLRRALAACIKSADGAELSVEKAAHAV